LKGEHEKILLLSVFCVLITMPVAAEYYQYKDSQGNLRFTDDPANIPKDTTNDIIAHESIENDNRFQAFPEDAASSALNGADTGNESLSDNAKAEPSTDRKALEEMSAALNKTAASLKAQHEELKAQVPKKSASKDQQKAYTEKVNTWNAKMEAYKKQHKEYNEKVKAYNAQLETEEKNANNGDEGAQ
jgi:chromosome segregation ATPase